MNYDVIIVGCGVSGLYAALNLPTSLKVLILSKGPIDQCDSMLAQGGICTLPEPSDYESFFHDTMVAGHWENRRSSVDVMIRSSKSVINDLISYGTDFERNPDGSIAYTREGAHARARICFHEDITGAEITTKLLAQVQARPNVEIREYVAMTDIVVKTDKDGEKYCAGVIATHMKPSQPDNPESPLETDEEPFEILAPYTLWATGGIGGTYKRSTNYSLLTGDACRIAKAHSIELEHMDYVQIHPTGFYTKEPGRVFLISESCRGEGAVLLNANKERFCNELQPRDVVTACINKQMELDGTDHVWLSFAPVDEEIIKTHFVHIYEYCLEHGYNILKEPIPVAPTQHYFMGGVHVDTNTSSTTLPRLFAAGETSCNGVHGKNRLASNSLLESLVFAQRAAITIAQNLHCTTPALDSALETSIDQVLIDAALTGKPPLNAPED